jgi:hypothetical protein
MTTAAAAVKCTTGSDWWLQNLLNNGSQGDASINSQLGASHNNEFSELVDGY